MPSRSITWLIIAFWVATAGWLFSRELWPRFRTNRPPVFFRPDYSDEVRTSPVRWLIYQDNRRIGSALREDDRIGPGSTLLKREARAFKLSSILELNKFNVYGCQLELVLESAYWFGLEGEVRRLDSKMTFRTITLPKGKSTPIVRAMDAMRRFLPIEVISGGKLDGNYFHPRVRIKMFRTNLIDSTALEPIEVPTEDPLINPMFPFETIYDLSEGQHWRMPLFDPLAESLQACAGKFLPLIKSFPSAGQQLRILDAEVHSAALTWADRKQACWVIDYRDTEGNVVVRTWVRQSDHWVLRQDAEFEGRRMVLARAPMVK